MNEFQREVAEVQWWLDRARPMFPRFWHDPSSLVYRRNGVIVAFTERQHAMLRKGDELWPARVRAAASALRSVA